MDITHLLTISTSFHCGAPNVLGLYKDKPILITVSHDSSCDLAVWDGTGSYHQPLAILSGHKTSINHVSLSKNEQWLFSVSKDTSLLWQLNSCLDTANELVTSKTREVSLHNNDNISLSCFNTNPCDHLMICNGSKSSVIDIHSGRVSCDLVTNSIINCATFYNSTCLVVACEDRTFQLWDISNVTLIYKSSVVSAFPFTCVDSTDQHLVFGSSNGVLRIYSTSGLLTKSCDLALHEIIVPNRSHDKNKFSYDIEIDDQSILSVHSFTNLLDKQDTHYRELITRNYSLLAVTHSGLLLFNGFNTQLLGQLDIGDSVTSLLNPDEPKYNIPFINSANFIYTSDNEILCSLLSVFSGTLSLIRIRINHHNTVSELSVLSSAPILRDSVLKAELVPRSSIPKVSSLPIQSSQKGLTPCGRVKDQPLTFRSKIKSSGYSQQPRMTMFSPHTNKSLLSSSSSAKKKSCDEMTYIVEECKYDRLSLRHSIITDNSPVTHSLFNGTGTQYFYTVNNTVFIMKSPYSSSSRRVPLSGHDGDILGIGCSHDNKMLITCSTDGSAKVWGVNPCNQQPIMNMTKQLHNLKETQSEAKDNKPFSDSLTHALFYYMDKFILLTCGNTIHMYKYHLDTNKSDDIKRYKTKSHYKMTSMITLDSTPHSVTALSCINDFHSYLVLAAGSDRSLQVYDMNVMKWIWLTSDAHKRPVHCITQNKGSKFINYHSSETHNLFATSSITDGIKLWDMRTQQCVRWYTCHKNRLHPVSTCFSPCGRYLATGSDDNMVYVYDTRYLEPVNKLICKTRVVSTVTYHPHKPLIIGATLEGEINCFETVSMKT